MDIKEKMNLMYDNPVISWHEHVWFNSSRDWTLNVANADRKVEVMTMLGFDRIVVSLPVMEPKRCPAEMFRAANNVVYEATKRYPGRCYGMAYVHAGHMQEALAEIDRCVQELGMVGVKLYYDYLPDDPVNAPIIEELPLVLECKLVRYDTETEICIGEVVNVSVDEAILDEKGKIDLTKFSPICYDCGGHGYYKLGEKVGKAFFDGLQLK
jgi:hypothetical protein